MAFAKLVQDKIATDKTNIMTKALAAAFVADVLEKHAKDLTDEEHIHASLVTIKACKKMQDQGVQVTAYGLFLQAVKFLEE